jgi:ATP-dependent DNA helicase RecG
MPEHARQAPPTPLDAQVDALKGVGPALMERLARLDLYQVRDLLLHLPLRYQDRSKITPLHQLQPGNEHLIAGEVLACEEHQGRRRALLIRVGDGYGFLTLRFFHFARGLRAQLRPGRHLQAFGEVRLGPNGLEMVHPEYRAADQPLPAPAEAVLTPVYPATEGVNQGRLRSLCDQALTLLDKLIAQQRPAWPAIDPWLDRNQTPELARYTAAAAIQMLHRPPSDSTPEQWLQARNRLALEELSVHMLLAREQRLLRRQSVARALPQQGGLGRELLRRLGFDLTSAQSRALREILHDLSQSQPMLRLLQGDVGSGKTVVAAFAAIRAAEHGAQTAIMVPTEILAEQHARTFGQWLAPLGIEVRLLTGKMSRKERSAVLADVANGQALVVVGTHALFQRDVDFQDLALVIIDEQHRFGVRQRQALFSKGRQPHQLVMTATPIPRTLTMTLYADMDLSVIDERPPGRQAIQTALIADSRTEAVIQRLGAVCKQGRQAYWVCTLIEESETLQASAAETRAETLTAALPELRIGLLHGRMEGSQKSAVMAEFKAGQLDLLVATSVIEVGVDVPNATLMVIENPERLGLAQLHQLRGRVGRGAQQSYCVLLYGSALSAQAQARLKMLQQSQDGFELAEVDLTLRGPGDLLGTRQTGERSFRIADLSLDAHLLPAALALADRLLTLNTPEELALKQALCRVWQSGGADFSNV